MRAINLTGKRRLACARGLPLWLAVGAVAMAAARADVGAPVLTPAELYFIGNTSE